MVLLLCLMGSLQPVLAQRRSYAVTVEKDTLYGTLLFDWSGTRLLTPSNNYALTPTLFECYYNAEEHALFRSRTLPGKKKALFIHCLETGPINLYAYYVGGKTGIGTDKNIAALYAERSGSNLTLVTNHSLWAKRKAQRQVLLKLIDDNRELAADFNRESVLSLPDIQYYIHEYNRQAVRM